MTYLVIQIAKDDDPIVMDTAQTVISFIAQSEANTENYTEAVIKNLDDAKVKLDKLVKKRTKKLDKEQK